MRKLAVSCWLLAVSAVVFAATDDGSKVLSMAKAKKGRVTLDAYPVACREVVAVKDREPSLLPEGRKFKLV